MTTYWLLFISIQRCCLKIQRAVCKCAFLHRCGNYSVHCVRNMVWAWLLKFYICTSCLAMAKIPALEISCISASLFKSPSVPPFFISFHWKKNSLLSKVWVNPIGMLVCLINPFKGWGNYPNIQTSLTVLLQIHILPVSVLASLKLLYMISHRLQI